MKKLLLIFGMLYVTHCCLGQQDTTNANGTTGFLPLIYANRQLTYLTFYDGIGNLPNMVTEARFSGNYFLKKEKINWALELNLNITIRIRDKKSFPIPPPSYNPVLTYYRRIPSGEGSFLSKTFLDQVFWEVSVGHHSNGKAESFYIEDSLGNDTGQINYDNGNFSTNYLELAFSTFKRRNRGGQNNYYTNLRTAFRFYSSKMSAKELRDTYGFYRLFLTYNLFKIPLGEPGKSWSDFFSRSRLRFHSGWIFGDMRDAAADDIDKRLIAEVTYFYYPGWLSELGFFVQYYRGQDYYNIQFLRTAEVFRVGISSNPLDFDGFKRILK
ncbi:hypothetical protein GCM10009122_53820 [Fulvivirga kasyanovii]|uniref:Phosphatidylcholine 1-acylhydrolase n=1 Tax=Fulvivirga kasyanovii TaxID=396812 RepID=A0ABW9RNZ9_9BACT|nr:hypothetical protein [Fulvivirga kasyanovii]MTI25630.1 hypothetical protein [Fulvivirga kasyanovii]